MAALGTQLLDNQTGVFSEAREFLLSAAMAGAIATGDRAAALKLWNSHKEALGAKAAQPLLRLLRCQSGPGCVADFAAYERR